MERSAYDRFQGSDDEGNELDEAFCCRCKEGFEVSQEPANWQMGMMRLLSKAPKRIREMFRDWLEHPDGKYLCGNCFFDLTDDD